jgi:8-oxo-dGTP pyrophosphatase MutT (NUDIX family)
MWQGFENGSIDTARCNGRMIPEREIIRRLAARNDLQIQQMFFEKRRSAAVLVPLVCQNGEWQLLYTRRTDQVPHHKGQVSFPGGAFEPGDDSLVQTALRETYEEIGLLPADVRILGSLEDMPSVSNYLIRPIVGRITKPFNVRLSKNEVSRVFTIPLEWLADDRHREMQPYEAIDGQIYDVIYYQPYDGEILWGATARMTVQLLELLGLIEEDALH